MEALLLRDRKFVVPAYRTRCDASKPIASEFMMRVISNYYKKTSSGVWQTLTTSNQQTHTPVQSPLCPPWSVPLRTPGASLKSLALAPRQITCETRHRPAGHCSAQPCRLNPPRLPPGTLFRSAAVVFGRSGAWVPSNWCCHPCPVKAGRAAPAGLERHRQCAQHTVPYCLSASRWQ